MNADLIKLVFVTKASIYQPISEKQRGPEARA
jgi:hypothetical protein